MNYEMDVYENIGLKSNYIKWCLKTALSWNTLLYYVIISYVGPEFEHSTSLNLSI